MIYLASITFIGCYALFFALEFIIDRFTHKRPRTREEQDFVDWYEFTEDYGFHTDITPAQHRRYNRIVKYTKWKPHLY